MAPVPSLDALPVQGISDSSLTVRQAREMLNPTWTILQGVLNAPQGLPATFRQSVQNVAFHVLSALRMINTYIGAGHYETDSINNVEGLELAIKNHVLALNVAKPLWNQWLTQEKASGAKNLPEVIVKTSALKPPGEKEGLMTQLSKPTSLRTYVGIGAAGVIGLVLWRFLK